MSELTPGSKRDPTRDQKPGARNIPKAQGTKNQKHRARNIPKKQETKKPQTQNQKHTQDRETDKVGQGRDPRTWSAAGRKRLQPDPTGQQGDSIALRTYCLELPTKTQQKPGYESQIESKTQRTKTQNKEPKNPGHK